MDGGIDIKTNKVLAANHRSNKNAWV